MSLREDLKAYLDGELDALRMEEIRVALERDPTLYQEYRELQTIGQGISLYAAQHQSQGLDATLAALGQTKRHRTLNWNYLWLPAGALVAAGLTLIFFMNGVKKDDSSGDSSTVAMSANDEKAKAPFQRLEDRASSPLGRPGQILEQQATPIIPPRIYSAAPRVVAGRKREPEIMRGALSSEPALQRAKLSPPNSIPQTVVLAFDSTEVGEKRVLDLVGKYRVQAQDSDTGVKHDWNLPPISQGPKTIVVEVPDDSADRTLDQLKVLPSQKPAPKKYVVLRSQTAGTMNRSAASAGNSSNGALGGAAGAAGGPPGGRSGGSGFGGGGIGGGFGGGFRGATGGPPPENRVGTTNNQSSNAQVNTTKSVMPLGGAGAPIPPPNGPQASKLKDVKAPVASAKVASVRKMRRIVIEIVPKATQAGKTKPVP